MALIAIKPVDIFTGVDRATAQRFMAGLQCSRYKGDKGIAMGRLTDEEYITNLYLMVYNRLPDIEETRECLRLIQDHLDFRPVLQRIISEKNCVDGNTTKNETKKVVDIYCTKSKNALDPSIRERVLKFCAQLTPLDTVGYGKVRVGRDWDGGYVMIDDFSDIEAAYSLGISNDVSWDFDIAERGICVNQYDGTIEGLPQHHPRFNWQGNNIGAESCADDNTISLKVAFDASNGKYDRDYLLKMDIEGAEWDVLATIDMSLIRQFRQIVCEIHDISMIVDDKYFIKMNRAIQNLTKFHNVVHVHANNNSHFVILGGVPVPNTLELTLLRRESRNFTPSSTTFPTHLDAPCSPQKADLVLGNFRFIN